MSAYRHGVLRVQTSKCGRLEIVAMVNGSVVCLATDRPLNETNEVVENIIEGTIDPRQ